MIRWKQPFEIPSAVCTGMSLMAGVLDAELVDRGLDYLNQSEKERESQRSQGCIAASSCIVACTMPAGAALVLAKFVDKAPEEIALAITGCEIVDVSLTVGGLGACKLISPVHGRTVNSL